MTEAALVDSERLRLAIAGTRIPARCRTGLEDTAQLLAEARRVLHEATAEAAALRQEARAAGRAEGAAEMRQQAAAYLAAAQAQARAFVDASEQRIAALAVAVVSRIAPGLEPADTVALLARQALAAVQAERYLNIRVHPAAVAATRTALQEWRLAHPALESAQVIGDEALEPLACLLESDLGSVQAGFSAQLDSVRRSLAAAAGGG